MPSKERKDYMKEYMKKYRLEHRDKIIKANKTYWDKRHDEENKKEVEKEDESIHKGN